MEAETAPSHPEQSGFGTRYNLENANRVLLLESDPGLRKVISITLHQLGVRVFPASSVKQAQALINAIAPHLFVLAMENPVRPYGNLIEHYRRRTSRPSNPVMVLTTRRLDDPWRRRYQPDAVLYKPFDIRFFISRIADLLKIEPALGEY